MLVILEILVTTFFLPQLGAALGSQVHGAAGLDAKGFEELGDVRQSGVDAVFGEAVDISRS